MKEKVTTKDMYTADLCLSLKLLGRIALSLRIRFIDSDLMCLRSLVPFFIVSRYNRIDRR